MPSASILTKSQTRVDVCTDILVNTMGLLASLFRWLQLKRYQYEVTFSLYMLTPTEKFIFNSFLFLFFSMIIIAATLYLPHHLAFVTNRASFYYNGPEITKSTVQSLVESSDLS